MRALIRIVERALGRRSCRGCGCTDHAACSGGCRWVEPDLCSECEWGMLAYAFEVGFEAAMQMRGT
jgi:hypothetical protein